MEKVISKTRLVFILIIGLIFFSRFVGIDWGLPYPMHPDERNIANAITSMNCEFSISNFQFAHISECLNPHFFAYGQVTIYMAFILVKLWQLITFSLSDSSFVQATLALRFISAISSIALVGVLFTIVKVMMAKSVIWKSTKVQLSTLLMLAFVPYGIQFAHFGTTETVLMLLYSGVVYKSILLLTKKDIEKKDTLLLGFFCGTAIAVKISAMSFVGVPALLFIVKFSKRGKLSKILTGVSMFSLSLLFFTLLFSPATLIYWKDFVSSMNYEIPVGTGAYKAFYTRQFEYSVPFLFQSLLIFPFALGPVVYGMSLLGFLFVGWKKMNYWLIKIAIVIGIFSSAFLYSKWTRFMAPAYPLMHLLAVLTVLQLLEWMQKKFKNETMNRVIVIVVLLAMSMHGVAYLSIYMKPDVRFTASEWIHRNVESNAPILSETANVVDIPVPVGDKIQDTRNKIQTVSFDFYNVDVDPNLQTNLNQLYGYADYIFIPSRRVFANHTCMADKLISNIPSWYLYTYESDRCQELKKTYPQLTNYYQYLLSGTRYKKVAEFSSYPTISIGGFILFHWKDEWAEETWTVFDHPVIRIYRML